MSPTPELSEANGDACPARPGIWRRLEGSVAKFPNRLAVASLHQAPDLYGIAEVGSSDKDYLRWSYAQLDTAVGRFAAGLGRLGLVKGDTVATYLTNGVEFVLSFWTAHRLGCTFAPLSPQSLHNEQESVHVLGLLKPAAVVVDGVEAATRLDKVLTRSASVANKILVGNAAANSRSSWKALKTLLAPERIGTYTVNDGDVAERDTTVAVLFTSGTTSAPKGAPHTDTTLNAFCENLLLNGSTEESVFCSVLPNNHAMGYFFVLHFMMTGAAVAYPSPTFDAEKMLEALRLERATHTTLVPATLHALAEALEARDGPLDSSLLDVCLAGSSVTPENLRFVVDRLGSRAVSTAFGMTEGSPVWAAPKTNPEDLINGHGIFSGRPCPGASVKICAQGSRTPLPLGQPGELHQAGPGLIKGYLGPRADNDQFYVDDEGRPWFVTGDQAVMYPDGRVSITGRYKDIINRGGEKIAPAAMEATIQRVCGLEVQVVGASDATAGQVPIVVVKNGSHTDIKAIRDAVTKEMGPVCAPDEVIALRELGIDDFPKTVSGKIKRAALALLVARSRNERDRLEQSHSSIGDAVLRAYHKATGIATEDLDSAAPTALFVDSIVSMRVRDRLRKDAGLILSMSDMAAHATIDSQITLLQERATGHTAMLPQRLATDDGLSTFIGDANEAERLEAVISKTLEAEGLSYGSVASIIPVPDLLEVLESSGIIETWNFAIAFVAVGATTESLRSALKKALTNNPILTSFYVRGQHEESFYVTVTPSDRLWKLCILDGKSLKGTADVQQLAINYPHPEQAKVPGPLFRCLVVRVEEANSAAFVMYLSHLVHDASSLRLFCEDLDQALSNPSHQLSEHVDFKAWADSFHALRHSPAAELSVRFHVRRLRHLHLHRKGLYPPAVVPRQPNHESPDGLDRDFDAPAILDIKRENPGMSAAVVLKAAMALVNVSRTNHTHALFNNFEAGRERFPFIPSSLEALSSGRFQASDVNGPVMQSVCNMVHVARGETAICFLNRLQADQLELTQHAHAPLRRVLDALRAEGNRADEFLLDLQRTQFTTWTPGFLGDYERLQVSQIAIRTAVGLIIIGSLGGPRATTFQFTARWDGANFSRDRTLGFLADLEAAILWLCEKSNWHKPVDQFLQGLRR